mgnify:CR=1 FL=1
MKEYRVPDSNVVIEKGTPIIISVLGLHMDPKYYPEPEKFDPERFTDEEKIKRHKYTYLPFGEGLHQCLGKIFHHFFYHATIFTLLKIFFFFFCSRFKIFIDSN